MRPPSDKPGKGLVPVKFTIDFIPYGVKAGDVRYVSARAADSLRKKWKCIVPLQVSNSVRDRKELPNVMIVEVLDKSLMKQFGSEWYPHSQHVVSREIYLAHTDVLKILTNDATEPEESHPVMVKRTPSLWWFQSHNWNGLPVQQAITCISLAYQCGIEESNNALMEWVKNGWVKNDGGKIVWDD